MLSISYENFEIWQERRVLLLLIYKITNLFPPNDTICLKEQLQENGEGILAHIVRSMRHSPVPINLDDLNISVQSLYELEKCLKKAYQNHLLKSNEFNQLKYKTKTIQTGLSHFIARKTENVINN
jgi:four helix bundle protein